MTMAHTLRNFLEQQQVPYELVSHRHTATSLRSAGTAHVDPAHLAKAVLLEQDLEHSHFVVAAVPASHRLQLGEAGRQLGRKVHLATEEDAATLFADCETGAIKGAEDTCALVLAASRGKELGELTEHQPKTMVNIQGTPILSHIVDAYNAVGIKDIVVVRGYKKAAVNLPNLTYVDNDDFADTGELDSLLKALRSKKGPAQDTVISYGDVLFNTYIPQSLCQESEDCVIFVDSNWQEQSSYARLGGFTECTIPNSRRAFNAKIYLKPLGATIIDPATGQPFAGNVIPSSRIDPVSKAFWDKYGYSIPSYGPNYSFQFANERKVSNINGRIDYNINQQHRRTVSGYWFKNETISPDARVQSISGGPTGGTSGNTFQKGGNELSEFPQTVLNGKWTFTPKSNLVIEARAAYSNMPERVVLAEDSLGPTLQTLGANDPLPRADGPHGLRSGDSAELESRSCGCGAQPDWHPRGCARSKGRHCHY